MVSVLTLFDHGIYYFFFFKSHVIEDVEKPDNENTDLGNTGKISCIFQYNSIQEEINWGPHLESHTVKMFSYLTINLLISS